MEISKISDTKEPHGRSKEALCQAWGQHLFIRSAVTEAVASAIRLTPVVGSTPNKAPEATGRVYPVEALQHRTAGPGRSRHTETLPPQSALKGQGDVTEGAEAAGWGRAEALAHCCPSWHLG